MLLSPYEVKKYRQKVFIYETKTESKILLKRKEDNYLEYVMRKGLPD